MIAKFAAERACAFVVAATRATAVVPSLRERGRGSKPCTMYTRSTPAPQVRNMKSPVWGSK